MSELSEREWRRLMQTIQRGNCILVLGPDIATDPSAPEGPALSSVLARKLADELPSGADPGADLYFPHVAQVYYQCYQDRVDLELAVEEFYRPFEAASTAFFHHLAALPFTLCINSTPDRFLFNAFREAGKEPLSAFYHFQKGRTAQLAQTDLDHPLVYDLYGSLQEPDSLALTENDLLEFLVNVIKGAPALPEFIKSQFGDINSSFLFLGFGFQRWHVRILLHALQAYRHRSRSLALESDSFFEHQDRSQTAVFFEQEYRFEFRQFSWLDFATELCRRYQAEAKPPQPEPEPPADAPLVFLCHNSPDHQRVAEVGQRLRTLGIRTWRDRDDLRGGDEWDRKIEHVIGKQIDYFVVLQSPRMMQQTESYFHKEINVALERQQRFGAGFRFVLPAWIEACAGLPNLAHLHTLDLSEDQGVQALGATIEDDWQARRRQTTVAPAGEEAT